MHARQVGDCFGNGNSGVFERTGAFPVPESSPDAALVFPLAPGAYTLEATGLGNGTGTVLLEAYGVP